MVACRRTTKLIMHCSNYNNRSKCILILRLLEDLIWCGRGDPGGLLQLRGAIAPLLDHRLLHDAGVGLAVHANLLGDFDTIGLRYEPTEEIKK